MQIYKYLSPDRSDVIRDARIRFTQPNALNDPFELKPFFRTIFNTDTFRQTIIDKMDLRPSLLEKYNEMPAEIRGRFNAEEFIELALREMENRKDEFESQFEGIISSLVHEMPALAAKLRDMLHGKLGSGVGILSLSKDPLNDVMWAHYAGDIADS